MARTWPRDVFITYQLAGGDEAGWQSSEIKRVTLGCGGSHFAKTVLQVATNIRMRRLVACVKVSATLCCTGEAVIVEM